jgi:hypothetical protein
MVAISRAATRLYTIALRAFPERHRAAYAAEMIDTFERELLARRTRLPGRGLPEGAPRTRRSWSCRRTSRHGTQA